MASKRTLEDDKSSVKAGVNGIYITRITSLISRELALTLELVTMGSAFNFLYSV